MPSEEHNTEYDVAVIIVGLNACDYIRGALKSIERADWRGRSHEVVYVDNGSSDGSTEMVETEFPGVKVLANPTNLGFCKAANQGAAASNNRYYFFLNDDTVVLDDAIALLVDFADATPGIGSIGSRLVYPDGREQFSGRRFPTLKDALMGRRSLLARWFPNSPSLRRYLCSDQLERDEPFVVDWVSAAAQLISRQVFEEVGGYAEDYYYWHEAVICDRIRGVGKTVMLHPASKIIHYEGKGSGVRPYPVQRFHIIDFHRGAFRCYCEHYRLGMLDLRRWVAALGLASRAAVKLFWARVTTLGERV